MENVTTKLGKLSISASAETASPNQLPKILVAANGTPSARRLPEICATLASFAEVKVVLTLDSHQYIHRQTLAQTYKVYSDEDQWTHPGTKPLSHELAEWADVFVIAPVSTNTLVQIALGLSYNLMTGVAQIWTYKSKKMFLFTDMDEKMWMDATSQAQVRNSLERNISLATPSGRMAETHVVVDCIQNNLQDGLFVNAPSAGYWRKTKIKGIVEYVGSSGIQNNHLVDGGISVPSANFWRKTKTPGVVEYI